MVTRRGRAGFTLVELMVVVVIVGVLAMTAVPAFQRFVLRARAAEAPAMLGQIRVREEAYRAEFGQYFGDPTPGAWHPSGTPDRNSKPWGTTSPLALLGVSPTAPVYFQYRVFAGFDPTNTAPPASYPNGLPNQWWFVAQARSDLNDDGIRGLVEAIAGRTTVWVGREDGSASAGWD